MTYNYVGLEPFEGCAGCEHLRRTERGPKEKERVMPFCLTKRIPRLEGPPPKCWQAQGEGRKVVP